MYQYKKISVYNSHATFEVLSQIRMLKQVVGYYGDILPQNIPKISLHTLVSCGGMPSFYIASVCSPECILHVYHKFFKCIFMIWGFYSADTHLAPSLPGL